MYTVTEWSPSVSGEDVGEFASIQEAADAANALYGAQITAAHWGTGYVVFGHAGSCSKHFHGCDQYGWGGDIPQDAERLEALWKRRVLPSMYEIGASMLRHADSLNEALGG